MTSDLNYDPQTKASKKRGKEKDSEFDTTIAKEGPLARWLPLERRSFKVRVKSNDPCACALARFGASGSKAKKPAYKKFADALCASCGGKGKTSSTVERIEERWVKVKPFKPSKQQLIKYMRRDTKGDSRGLK